MLDNQTRLTRRAGMSFLAALGLSVLAAATPARAEVPELLFVQSAPDVAVTSDQLRLKNIATPILFFSDRPNRITGHINSDEWQKLWTENRERIMKDPPNAVLSVFEPGKQDPTDTVVELVDMKSDGPDFVYTIKVLKGSLPAGGQSSLFIDDVPLDAPGFAGVEARDCYRHGCADF